MYSKGRGRCRSQSWQLIGLYSGWSASKHLTDVLQAASNSPQTTDNTSHFNAVNELVVRATQDEHGTYSKSIYRQHQTLVDSPVDFAQIRSTW